MFNTMAAFVLKHEFRVSYSEHYWLRVITLIPPIAFIILIVLGFVQAIKFLIKRFTNYFKR